MIECLVEKNFARRNTGEGIRSDRILKQHPVYVYAHARACPSFDH